MAITASLVGYASGKLNVSYHTCISSFYFHCLKHIPFFNSLYFIRLTYEGFLQSCTSTRHSLMAEISRQTGAGIFSHSTTSQLEASREEVRADPIELEHPKAKELIKLNGKEKNSEKSTAKVTRKKKKRTRPKSINSRATKSKKSKLVPLANIALGSKIDGVVAGFTDFGIFIKTNVDMKGKGSKGYALLHKSQIRDEPIDDLAKLFRIGAVLKNLRVIDIKYAKGEVGVSLRKQREKRKKLSDIKLGVDMTATVSKVMPYGAFLDFGYDKNALLHVSRMSQKKITNVRQWLNEGDKVVAHVINTDKRKGTMAASMLDMEADRFLDKRSAHITRIKERSEEIQDPQNSLSTELEYFNSAIRDLEESVEAS